MKKTPLAVFLLFSIASFAQRPAPDRLETSGGALVVQPLSHATLVLTWKGKTVYADPTGGTKMFEGLAEPDLILITDIHGDHFNAETLGVLNLAHAKIIAPQAVADKMSPAMKEKTIVLGNGKAVEELGIGVEAIPMYNLPETPDSKHTKGRGNGYIVSFGNKRIYISGDTSGIPEMKALKNIDAAFVCMNLPYTMDVKEAAAAVISFKPHIVYPYHYRGQNGLSDTAEFKKLVNAGDASIDVRLRDWYPK
jgi:L-ascorbate metabolism protein UlaG (beta-lactamase superfamily)